ncbi:hypothetical protein, partial [Escherichia coli]
GEIMRGSLSAGRDKGHQWMEEQLVSICKR